MIFFWLCFESDKELLGKKVKQLKHVFNAINGFPSWIVSPKFQINQDVVNSEPLNVKQHRLIFPYKGKKGGHTLKNAKRHVTKLLPEQEGEALVFTGTKLATKTSKKHQHDLTYSAIRPDANCNEKYNGKTGRRLIERFHEHSGKNVSSHIFKHSIETDHPTVTINDFRVLKRVIVKRSSEQSYLSLYSSSRINLL